MRVAIAIRTLMLQGRGGSEHSAVQLAAALSARGHEVLMVACAPHGETQSMYALPPNVKLLLYSGSYADNMRRTAIEALRRRLVDSGIDVCLVFTLGNELMPWPVALMGTGIALCVSERIAPEIIERERWSREDRMACMAAADRIVLMLPEFERYLAPFLRSRARVIPNATPAQDRVDTNPTGGECKRLLYMGRLAESQKQVSLLIDAFYILHRRFPDWELDIWGDGPDREALQQRIAAYGANLPIHLRGVTLEPGQVYQQAQLLCISSRYEGIPRVVIEAMSYGLPIVGFAGCCGVNSMVRDGENGILAPQMTAESLAGVLGRLMSRPLLREAMGQASRRLAAIYEPNRIYALWERVLEECVALRPATALAAMQEESFKDLALLVSIARRKHLLLTDRELLSGRIKAVLEAFYQPRRQEVPGGGQS